MQVAAGAGGQLLFLGLKPFGMTKAIWAEVETFMTTSVEACSRVDITEHWRSPRATLTGVPQGMSNHLWFIISFFHLFRMRFVYLDTKNIRHPTKLIPFR